MDEEHELLGGGQGLDELGGNQLGVCGDWGGRRGRRERGKGGGLLVITYGLGVEG